jgi:hypothetical protein
VKTKGSERRDYRAKQNRVMLEDRADEDRKAVKKGQGEGEDKIISAKKGMRQEIRMKVRKEAIR